MLREKLTNHSEIKMKPRGRSYEPILSAFQRALLKQKHREKPLTSREFLKLCKLFDLSKMPDKRTAQRYIAKFNEELSRANYDKLVDWDDLDKLLAEYPIYHPDEINSKNWRVHREHLDRLREVESWAMQGLYNLDIEFKASWKSDDTALHALNTRTTYRSLKWQDYFLTYTSKLGSDFYTDNPMDVWVIGELYASREMDAEAHNEPIDLDDLKAWLEYRPFVNDLIKKTSSEDPALISETNARRFYVKQEKHEERYLRDIERGLIPELKFIYNHYSVNSIIALAFMSLDHVENRTDHTTPMGIGHRLPSIQYGDLINQGVNPEITVINPVTDLKIPFCWNLLKQDTVSEEDVTNEPFSDSEDYDYNRKNTELLAVLSDKTREISKLENLNTALTSRIFDLTDGGEGKSEDTVTNEPFIAPP